MELPGDLFKVGENNLKKKNSQVAYLPFCCHIYSSSFNMFGMSSRVYSQ